MSAKASDTFPDLHHKMSKKIAQLTKVIYHLNTRNEDHQADVDALNANHQTEVQAILRDAAAKLAKFKDAIDNRQQQVNDNARFEKLHKKHALEKQQALEEFQAFRESSLRESKAVADQYKAKIDNFKTDIENMNAKFQEKITAFEATTNELKSSLDQAKKSGSSDIDSLKRAHEQELAELVRSSNAKYQALVVSHLKEMESLNNEMASKIKQVRDETRQQMVSEMEQQLGQLKAKLDGDRQSALMEQKRDFDEKMKVQREESSAKLDVVLNDLQAKSAESKKLKAELDALQAEMDRKLKEMTQALAAQAGDSDAQTAQLKDMLKAREQDIAALKAELVGRNQEIGRLDALAEENAKTAADLQQVVNSQKQSIADLMNQLAKASEDGSTNESALKSKISWLEKDVTSMTEDIAKNGKLLLAARDDLKRSEATAKAAANEAAAKMEELRAEIESLKKRLSDALSNSKSSEEGLLSEVNALKKKISDNEEKYRANLADTTAAHKAEVESLKSSHNAALAALNDALRATQEKGFAGELALRSEMAKLKEDHEGRYAELVSTSKRSLEEAQEAHLTDVTALKATIEALEQQMQEMSSNADGERGSLKNQVTKLEEKNKALHRELESKKKDGERVESVVTGLKNQVESLREELKASQAAYREKMESSLAKLDADWQSKMDLLIAEHTAALEAASAAAESYLLERLAELRSAHEEEILALKSALKKEASDASEELVKAEHERLRLEEALTECKALHEKTVRDHLEKHKLELEQAEARRKKEIDSLQRELLTSAESSTSALIAKHNQEMESLREGMEQAMKDLSNKHASELETHKLLAEDTLKAALAELEAKMLSEKTNALASSAARHAHDIAKLQEERDLNIAKLKEHIHGLERSLSLSQQDVNSMQHQLETNQRERASREEQVVLERDQMQRDHQTDIRKERDRAQRALADSAERAAQDLRDTKATAAAEKDRLEEVIIGIRNEMKALNAKYNNRESRQEDLELIQRLRFEMEEKDRLVAETQREMVTIKMELLNREDSYNQKFNRTPNVGVMNVLKTKETSDKGGMGGGGPGGKKAAPTQFRPLNPAQAGGGLPGIGGIGGLAMSGSAPMQSNSAKR